MQYQTHQVVSNKNNAKKKKKKELPTSENENITHLNNTLPSNYEETLSSEQQTNLENIKRIISSEKTTLPSLRNIEWKTLKIETNKINHILPYIPTNNITELNELIYAGAKLVFEKIGIPWRTERMSQRIQRHSRITQHRSTHPKREQDKTEKSSYGLDWLQEGIWYGSA